MGKRGAKSAQKEIVNIVQTSADVRPTDGISGGSLLKETDTGNLYTFDESTSEWVLICTVSPSGGGGNPNTVQTITGTLANPFGDVNALDLIAAIDNNTASAKIHIDDRAYVNALNGFDIPIITIYQAYLGVLFCMLDSQVENSVAFQATWDGTNTVQSCFALSNGTVIDMLSLASSIPTTLTIIWHPVP